MTAWPAKLPAERFRVGFFFDGELAPGETIAAAALAVELLAGLDPAPALLLDGTPEIDDASGGVLQMIHGGVAGCAYGLTCLATTSAGRALARTARLPVRRYLSSP